MTDSAFESHGCFLYTYSSSRLKEQAEVAAEHSSLGAILLRYYLSLLMMPLKLCGLKQYYGVGRSRMEKKGGDGR